MQQMTAPTYVTTEVLLRDAKRHQQRMESIGIRLESQQTAGSVVRMTYEIPAGVSFKALNQK